MVTNIGTMTHAYGVAFGIEFTNSTVDVFNGVFGTDYDFSFDHNHPIK